MERNAEQHLAWPGWEKWRQGWHSWVSRWFGSRFWSPRSGEEGAETPVADVRFRYAGDKAAVLLIHGLTGTPTEMRYIGKGLAAEGFAVYGMQLAGHCGSEERLLQSCWQDWYASVEDAYQELAAVHSQVFVAGLSMGALLAIHLAAAAPSRLAGIACYSTTLWYDGWAIPKLQFLLPLLLATPLADCYRFVENYPYGIKDERLRQWVVESMHSGNSALAGNLGTTGRSLRELQRLVGVVLKEMPQVKVPALVLHAREDDMTSIRNADHLERHLGGMVRKVFLDDCYHIITIDRQRHEVIQESSRFFQEIMHQHQQHDNRPL
ncbi:alpha/beta hydrolase [Candidatus Magnetaquicoccus inordinatus]|uniref:alpha/beta hydrolase n=1 Tax=Candidatus Magnetaquicoccus inordinatus TaxID=2496818 RepID=UPI00102AE34A|nr:alpha/beta fold hydrolase [Candidatus Magnetaquicoccus inordinatus]